MRRRAVLAAARASRAAPDGGCSVLPAMPDPVPTERRAHRPAPRRPRRRAGNLSPDGFDSAQRMAVRIRNIGCGTLSTGSGFAIDDHTLVTNRHVVADSSTLQVSTYDGRDIAAAAGQHRRPGRPRDRAHRRRAARRPRARAGRPRGRRRRHGRRLPARAGADRDHRARARAARPTRSTRTSATVLVTDAPVEPGSSGSAVLDADGRVVGVVYAKDANGHSFVVPVSTLRSMLDDEACVHAR